MANISWQMVQGMRRHGGTKYVFAQLKGKTPVYLPNGAVIQNLFKGNGKFYAGDLANYQLNGTATILKTFKLAKAIVAEADNIEIVADAYSHVPEVGDILMKAPTTFSGKSRSATITRVEFIDSASAPVFKCYIVAGGLDLAAKGDILVEAETESAIAVMRVKKVTAFLTDDIEVAGGTETASATFVKEEYAHTARMGALPAVVLAENKEKIDGLFRI